MTHEYETTTALIQAKRSHLPRKNKKSAGDYDDMIYFTMQRNTSHYVTLSVINAISTLTFHFGSAFLRSESKIIATFPFFHLALNLSINIICISYLISSRKASPLLT